MHITHHTYKSIYYKLHTTHLSPWYFWYFFANLIQYFWGILRGNTQCDTCVPCNVYIYIFYSLHIIRKIQAYTTQYKLHFEHYTLHTKHWKIHITEWTNDILHNSQYTLHIGRYALRFKHKKKYTLHLKHYTFKSTNYKLHITNVSPCGWQKNIKNRPPP